MIESHDMVSFPGKDLLDQIKALFIILEYKDAFVHDNDIRPAIIIINDGNKIMFWLFKII